MSPFGGYHDDYHEEIFVPAIEAAGLKATRADDLYRPSPIVQDIWQLIRGCSVGLADVTGRNPNVLYELGLAHAITKPVVLVTRDIDDVPFDLRGLRHVTYDVNAVRWDHKLQQEITAALKQVMENPTSCVPFPFVQYKPSEAPITVTGQEHRYIAIEQKLDAILASQNQGLPTSDTGLWWTQTVAAHDNLIALRSYSKGVKGYILRRSDGTKRPVLVVPNGQNQNLQVVQKLAQAQEALDAAATELVGGDTSEWSGWGTVHK